MDYTKLGKNLTGAIQNAASTTTPVVSTALPKFRKLERSPQKDQFIRLNPNYPVKKTEEFNIEKAVEKLLEINPDLGTWNTIKVEEFVNAENHTTLYKLAEMKNENDTFRLDAYDFKTIAPHINKGNSQTLIKLAQIENKVGNHPYGNWELCEFAPLITDKNKKAILEFAMHSNIEGNRQFSTYDITSLAPHIDDENCKPLIEFAQAKDSNGKFQFERFNLETFAPIITKENKNALLKLTSLKDKDGECPFRSYHLEEIAPLINDGNSDVALELANLKNENGNFYFSVSRLIETVQNLNEGNKATILELAKLPGKESKFRFGEYNNLPEIAPHINKDNGKTILALAKLKTKDGSYVFDNFSLPQLAKDVSYNNKELIKLANIKQADEDLMFSMFEISVLGKIMDKENESFISQLITTLHKNGNLEEAKGSLLRILRHVSKGYTSQTAEFYNELLLNTTTARDIDKEDFDAFFTKVNFLHLNFDSNVFSKLLSMKTKTGENTFNLVELADILTNHEEMKFVKISLAGNIVGKSIKDNDLYEITFKEYDGEKFGCKNFKELEEHLKNPKNAKEAGKTAGLIKKETMLRFYNSLPTEFKALFSGKLGFVTSDFEKAIDIINQNNLQEYLINGEFRQGDELAKSTFMNKQIANQIFGKNGKAALDSIKAYLNTSGNPSAFNKEFANCDELADLLVKRFNIDYPNESFTEADIFALKEESIPNMINFLRVFGRGNLNNIFTNESFNKIGSYASIFETINKDKENLALYTQAFHTKSLQDNEFKKLAVNIAAYINSGESKKLTTLLTKMVCNQKIDNNELTTNLYKIIAKQIGLSEDAITGISAEEIKKWDIENFPYISVAMGNLGDKDKNLLAGIFKTTINRNYQEFLFDTTTETGKLNTETRKIFKREGLNFDKWMNYEPVKKFIFTPTVSSIDSTVEDIAKDLKLIQQNEKLKQALAPIIIKSNIIFNGTTLLAKNGKEIDRTMLLEFAKTIHKFTSDNGVTLRNMGILDVKDHFAHRIKALSTIVSTSKPEEMTISLWKRNPHHDLFQGHFCQSCISLDGVNAKAIVQSLSHVVDNILELKNSTGKTVGKAKLVWIKDTKLDEPVLLVNGFEIITPYAKDDTVREEFTKYLKGYAKEVAGKDVIIAAGNHPFQKLNVDLLTDGIVEAQLLGKTPENTYHLDSYMASKDSTNWPKNLDQVKTLSVKILHLPEVFNHNKIISSSTL